MKQSDTERCFEQSSSLNVRIPHDIIPLISRAEWQPRYTSAIRSVALTLLADDGQGRPVGRPSASTL